MGVAVQAAKDASALARAAPDATLMVLVLLISWGLHGRLGLPLGDVAIVCLVLGCVRSGPSPARPIGACPLSPGRAAGASPPSLPPRTAPPARAHPVRMLCHTHKTAGTRGAVSIVGAVELIALATLPARPLARHCVRFCLHERRSGAVRTPTAKCRSPPCVCDALYERRKATPLASY